MTPEHKYFFGQFVSSSFAACCEQGYCKYRYFQKEKNGGGLGTRLRVWTVLCKHTYVLVCVDL